MYRILTGDVTKMLKTLADESVQCVVTSPPYWGLRNYGVEGQLGLERTPEEYVEKMVSIFHELRRVLRNDGTLFLNIGDSYMAHPNQRKDTDAAGPKQRSNVGSVGCPSRSPEDGLRAAACDTSDIEPASSASHDCLCESLCDACRRAYQIGKSHSGSRPVPTPKTLPSAPTRERRESANDHSPTLDSSGQESRTEDAIRDQPQDIESFASVLLDAQESTSPESSLPLQEGFRQSAPSSICRLCGGSLPDCALGSVRRTECNCGTGLPGLVSHSQDKDVSGSAYLYSTTASLKPKDLVGIPWMLAFALRADGWYLRQEIIWAKPNPMPESVTDRCTKSHESLFLLTKSARYFYDQEAIKEPCGMNTHARGQESDVRGQGLPTPAGWDTSVGEGGHGGAHKTGRHLPGNKTHKGTTAYENGDVRMRTKSGLVEYASRMRANYKGSLPGRKDGPGQERRQPEYRDRGTLGAKGQAAEAGENRSAQGAAFGRGAGWRKLAEQGSGTKNNASFDRAMAVMPLKRNKRSVWTITTQGYKEAHFATFPEKLVEPCLLAGTSEMGCCPECGAPWERVYNKRLMPTKTGHGCKKGALGQERNELIQAENRNRNGHKQSWAYYSTTTGWLPTCRCGAAEPCTPNPGREPQQAHLRAGVTVPCTVLDPFSGAGTTGVVALKHQRNYIGIELSPEYVQMSERRLEKIMPLFNREQKQGAGNRAEGTGTEGSAAA